MVEKKLLDWLNANFDFDSQEWIYDTIPDEILDCVLDIMRREDDFESLYEMFDDATPDFITDFIFDQIVNWKQGEITKLWLKRNFEKETESLFD